MDKQNPRRMPTDDELEDLNSHWNENGQVYDPNRGDHVDHLNDTTPPLEPVKYPRTERRKKKHHGWIWLLLLLLIAGVGYYYLYTHKPSETPAPTTSQQPAKPKQASEATTTHYDSSNYFLGLDYPTSWKLNDGPTALTVTSPKMALKTAAGKTVQGYVRVSMQPKQTLLPAFDKGSAQAVIESQKISYKKPTQNQRALTYISFASYATTVGNGWDALYVTGDNGYQLGQMIPKTDILQNDPFVMVSFLDCTDQTCSGKPTPLTLNVSEWENASVSGPIKNILQSLSLN